MNNQLLDFMRKILVLFFAITATMAVNAQLLYKVTGNGAKGTSYIFGTHHIAPVSILDSVAGFNEALASVDVVYGEIVQEALTAPSTQQLMLQKAMAPADSTLSKLLSPSQLDSLDVVLKKYSGGMLSVAQLDPVTPAFVGMQLAVMQSMTFFPEFSATEQLDVVVQQRGKEQGKELGGFETVEFQIELLYGDPLIKQAEDLMEAVRLDEKMEQYSKTLADAYMSQDLAACYEVITEPQLGFDEDEISEMLTDRNERWCESLQPLFKEKTILVCVGAGHLLGDNGLLNLLKKAGYVVEPVK